MSVNATALMQLVAGRSPAALRGALSALRAIRVDSPVVTHRVSRVAQDALTDPGAEWSDAEREALADAAGASADHPYADDPARDCLSALLTTSGLSQVELARVLGRDERTVRRWLGGQMPIPQSVADWLDRMAVEVEPEAVTLRVSRG